MNADPFVEINEIKLGCSSEEFITFKEKSEKTIQNIVIKYLNTRLKDIKISFVQI